MAKKLLVKYRTVPVQIKASFWFLICSVLQKGISVITTPIFTRLLSTAEYGQYSVFNSWLSIVSVIVTMNLCAGVFMMGIVKFKDEAKIFTSSLQGLTLTLCLVWTVIYVCTRSFWNSLFELTTVQMLALLLMTWTSAVFNFWMTTQRNAFRYRMLIIVTLIVSILKPLLGVILVINAEDKVTARILGLAIVEVVCYTIFFFIQIKQGKTFYSAKYWKYAILFNLPLIPHYLSNVVLSSFDRIMIQKMVGESAAGVYSLACSVGQIMLMINEALNKTMSPYLYQKIREKKYNSFSGVAIISLMIVAVANLFLIAVAPEIVAIFAPAEYYEAIYAIVPVAMSGYFTYMYLCFSPFEFYYEKRIWTTISTLTSAVLNIGLNYVCIPIYGYVAAGYTTLACYILNALLHYHFMRKVCRTYMDDIHPYSAKQLLAISVGFLIVGLAFIPTYQNMFVRYVLIAVIIAMIVLLRKRWLPLVKNMYKKEK